MKKVLHYVFFLLLIAILLVGMAVGTAFLYVRQEMKKTGLPYTETVENILVDQVPAEGITVYGRTYDASSVRNFLEEIRYDPYNYIHKDHHCILQYVPQDKIQLIVSILRVILGVGGVF